MKRFRHSMIGLFFLVAVVVALFGVNRLGLALKRQAVASWLEKANNECQRITDTSLGWFSLFHAQLRGVASLFYGSEIVTQNEFLDALDLIEGVELEAMIPLTSVAYAEQRSTGRPTQSNTPLAGSFPVTLSSDAVGLLAVGRELGAHPEIHATILSALAQPQKVIMGPVFRGENNQMFTAFTIKAINDGKPGVLVSVVNLSDFITDLEVLRIPEGLNLRIVEHEGKPTGDSGAVVTGDRLPPAQTVATATFPTQSGQAHWKYFWDVLPHYQGGPTTVLGTVVQFGGNVLVLSVFFIIASLFLQNVRVNHLVARRTEELVVATRAAEAANRAKSLFLANMSHELRTPLNIIQGYSQLMRRDMAMAPRQREQLNAINRSSEHLLALINDILEISKIEAGKSALDIHTFAMRSFFDDLAAIFESSTKSKGLRFEIIGVENLPPYVATDENKLRRILINVLGNAVKFTEQGGIIMRVAVKDETPDGMRLMIEVEDTGVGIAEEELDNLFAYFEQTASGRAEKSGTGLGLAISRDFARMMGGDITVASVAGKGSTFRVAVAVQEGSVSEVEEEIRPRRVLGLEAGQEIPRILVAEDSAESRLLLSALLQNVGFQVREAENGKAAVDLFHQWRPHFIWMDVRMPVMDGLEATRRIKETEAGRLTIVAALTAHALEEEKAVILDTGCDDFVRKPYREEEIFEVMAAHLGIKYVYEVAREEPDLVASDVDLRPERLARLPEDLRGQLYQSVVELDEDRIRALIEEIKTVDPPLATVLNTFANKFALWPLLDLLEKSERPRQDDRHD